MEYGTPTVTINGKMKKEWVELLICAMEQGYEKELESYGFKIKRNTYKIN